MAHGPVDKAWHFVDGKWIAGNPPILGAWSHATWLGCVDLRRRARLRGRDARSRPALPARDPLGDRAGPEIADPGRRDRGDPARGHRQVPQGHAALLAPLHVVGGRLRWRPIRPATQIAISRGRDAAARSDQERFLHAFRNGAGPRPRPRPPTPRPSASMPRPAAPPPMPSRKGFDDGVMLIRSAMSPSSPRPISGSPRTAPPIRRSPTALPQRHHPRAGDQAAAPGRRRGL